MLMLLAALTVIGIVIAAVLSSIALRMIPPGRHKSDWMAQKPSSADPK